MRRLLLCLLLAGPAIAAPPTLPGVTHYSLSVKFLPAEGRIDAAAMMTIRNATGHPFQHLPFLLYRLMTVGDVRDAKGTPLTFSSKIVPFGDEPSLQANAVDVALSAPLQSGDSTIVAMRFGGFMFGYPEVMQYVQDRIDTAYSLLRPDALAYPQLAEPSFASALAASETKFTYELAATVPTGYRVACGGAALDLRAVGDSSTFRFQSKVPTWRIDIAAARFAVTDNLPAQLLVYHEPADSAGARVVLREAENVIKLYTEMFGKPTGYQGYTIIEIPEGWGSQASDYYFLQTAAAFRDTSKMHEVYHEIGHTWNAPAAAGLQRCRYFDEAFASFFEALALRKFRGEQAFLDRLQKSRDRFTKQAQSDTQAATTPIADYGTKELGGYSYTKGAWSLYVLYTTVGEESFCKIVRSLLAEYASRGISFGEFETLCERVAHRDLKKFFGEWIYGTASSQLMTGNATIGEIVKRY